MTQCEEIIRAWKRFTRLPLIYCLRCLKPEEFLQVSNRVASAFIDRVCNDAKTNGYVAVEGYAKLSDQRNDFDFQGPYRLYQKAGFIEIAREKEQVVMRKVL